MSKKVSKYIDVFEYFVLSARSSEVSIIFFTTAIGAPVGILSASFSLTFSLTTGIIKKLLQIKRRNIIRLLW